MVEKIWEVAEKKSEDLLTQLLFNRGLTTELSQGDFLKIPDPATSEELPLALSGIESAQLTKAVTLIKNAIQAGQPIIIHGDYDVDGLAATAILWEAIYFGLKYRAVYPFIPNRFTDGYGLSRESIEKIKQQHCESAAAPLLITVDCGITAVEEVSLAKALGFAVIVVDHHALPAQRTAADAIVWTETLCSGGISWFVAQSLLDGGELEQRDLAALATVADLQPLLGLNRSFVRSGLAVINQKPRPGLKALMVASRMPDRLVGTYELGWLLGPRLNAAGRLESAVKALKLLLTRNLKEAIELAGGLNEVNSERQRILGLSLTHARTSLIGADLKKFILVADESYHEGVIGLVAGKLVQEFYRPALVIAKGETVSKGSARSISGFNIIEALRRFEGLFEGVGGHPMAAGFTIRNENLTQLEIELAKVAEELIDEQTLTPKIKVEAELPAGIISQELPAITKKLEPFGVGNPQPIFLARALKVTEVRKVGASGGHLKLGLTKDGLNLPAIWFGAGSQLSAYQPGSIADIVFTVLEDSWNGYPRVSLNVKDARLKI